MAQANIPRGDSAAALWMRGFVRLLVAEPGTFHVTPEAAAEVAAAVATFRSALAVVRSPSTCTRPAVVEKTRARAAAEQICRRYYSSIKIDPQISDANKVRIGVRPLNRKRSRKGPPTTAPMVLVFPGVSNSHLLRFADVTTPERFKKPALAAMVQLFAAVADGPVDSPEGAKLLNCYTACRVRLHPPHRHAGKCITYFARWAGPTGKPGPWSAPTSQMIAPARFSAQAQDAA